MNRVTWSVALGLLLFGCDAFGQSSSTPHPPAQTYIYDFLGRSYAVAPLSPVLDLGRSYTIEFWIMLDRDAIDSQYMRPFNKGEAYGLEFEPGTHRLSYRGVVRTTALVPGVWSHVAIVSNNLKVTLYLNGQLQGTFTAGAPPPVSSSPLVLAGQTYGDGATQLCCGFPGSLRQFRIWNKPLTEPEIATVASQMLSGSEPGLVANWPIDDGKGNALRDLGPNHLALSLKTSSPITPGRSPQWMRTAVLDAAPYFQVQRLNVTPPTIQSPALTIPIDFDSNGTLDLIACQAYRPAAVPCAAFRNLGNGTFREVTAEVLGPQPPAFETARDYAVADFNGDGRSDIFIANTGECFPYCGLAGGHNALLLQTADGRLANSTIAAGFPQARMFTHNVAAADVDGDGDVDLFLANGITGDLGTPLLCLNDGQGHFTVADPSRLTALLGSAGYGVARFLDANRDGSPDLVLGSGAMPDSLLLNDGKGSFARAGKNALPITYGGLLWHTQSFDVVDFDGDGWLDLVNTVDTRGDREGAVQILLNNREGTFRDATDRIVQPAWPHSTDATPQAWVKVAFTADFNGDGLLDILVEHGPSLPPRLLLNTGPAGGGRLVEITEMLPASHLYDSTAFAVADFNGDGSNDIVAWTGDFATKFLETWTVIRPFAAPPSLIPAVTTGPFFQRGAVLNSASFGATTLAPGLLVTIFGRSLGPDSLTVASPQEGAFPTDLAGTRVLFNGVAAPIIYTSSGVVSVVVPFQAVPGTYAEAVVEHQGTRSAAVSIYVESSAPALFTLDSSGMGSAAVLNVDVNGTVSLNTPQNPAPRGGVITAYVTGAGLTSPPSPDGALGAGLGGLSLPIEAGLEFWAVDDPYATSPVPCASSQYCQPVEVLYAGPAPGIIASVIQVNMRLPNSPRASGTRQLGVSIGGVWSQHLVTISIR